MLFRSHHAGFQRSRLTSGPHRSGARRAPGWGRWVIQVRLVLCEAPLAGTERPGGQPDRCAVVSGCERLLALRARRAPWADIDVGVHTAWVLVGVVAALPAAAVLVGLPLQRRVLAGLRDRKSVGSGTSVSVRLDLGVCRIFPKQHYTITTY